MSISYDNNKIISFYKEGKELHCGKMVIPRFVSIWLTTSCNLNCGYCWFNNLNKEKTFFKIKKLYEIIDTLAKIGVEAIEFSGGGEPTLHPNCFYFIKHAYYRGLKVGLLTNGYKFDLHNVKYLSYIRVGLDAYSTDIYTKVKGVDNFDKVVSNIKELVEYKKTKNIEGLRLGTKFMLNRDNCKSIEDIRQMIALSRDLGVNYCHFKLTHNDSNGFGSEFLEELSFKFISEKVESKGFVYGNIEKLEAKVKCFMSPIHTVITTKGDVLVCCYFYQDEYILGNLHKESFDSIWYGERHYNIIDKITVEQCNKYDCRWSSYNETMNKILNKGYLDLSFI